MPVSYYPSSAVVKEEKPVTTAKKRRRRQNDEIEELGELLPVRGEGGKPLDKLSILRLTNSYIRFQNFMSLAYGENGESGGNVLSDLMDQAMDGFLMVVGSDGVILYASDNMESFVSLNPRDVIGHSLHDLVQSEEDKETVTTNLQPKGNQLNQRRLFYIRLRNEVTPGQVRVSRYNTNLTLQVSGHLKVVLDHSLDITFGKLLPELEVDPEYADKYVPPRPHVLGLIVECRPIESSPSILELSVPQGSFTTTIGLDMKIQSVDTTVREVLGFEPKDFIGTGLKDYFHPVDTASLLPCKNLLQRTGYAVSPTFRFMTASGDWAWVQLEGTIRFDKETRKPKHLETLVKIVSQSEGNLKYIEQKEFYSHGKTNQSLLSLHQDPYDNMVPDAPLPQTPESISRGLKEAKVPQPAIDVVLHSRSQGLSLMPHLMCDIVPNEEEAEKLASRNQERFKKAMELGNLKDGDSFDPMCMFRLMKEVRENEGDEGMCCSPQSVASTLSPAPSSASQTSSVPSYTPPSSVYSSEPHVPSPYSVPPSGPGSIPGMAPSPQSASSLAPSPHSIPSGHIPSPHSIPPSQIPSPHSRASLAPSPHSIPLSHIPSPHSSTGFSPRSATMNIAAPSPHSIPPGQIPSPHSNPASVGFDTRSPDSGIDSPDSSSSSSSSGNDSTPNNSFLSTQFQNFPPHSSTGVSQSHFQPSSSTSIPSTFNFNSLTLPQSVQTDQQPVGGDVFLAAAQAGAGRQVPAAPATASGQVSVSSEVAHQALTDLLLSDLITTQQQQQQQQHQFQPPPPPPPPPPASQDWIEKQRLLQEQIQTQKQLLQNLMAQQKHHQMMLPGQPQPQQTYHSHSQTTLASSYPPPPPPSSSSTSHFPNFINASTTTNQTVQRGTNFDQSGPNHQATNGQIYHHLQGTNFDQNGPNHNGPGNISFVGSVGLVSMETDIAYPPLPPPSPGNIQELLQQFQ